MARCFVSFIDLDGVRHGVDVQAESLYEAASIGPPRLLLHPGELFGELGPPTAKDGITYYLSQEIRT